MRLIPPRYNTKYGHWGFNLRRYADMFRYRQSLTPADFSQANCFVAFVGGTRTGSTLLGALLDAHPDAVIATEADAFGAHEQGFDRTGLYRLLLENARQFSAEGAKWTGYNYAVPGQWQGRCRAIRVIGDKKAGRTTRRLDENPDLLNQMAEMLQLPICLIHTIRNPFDVVATRKNRANRNKELREISDGYFRQQEKVQRLKENTHTAQIIDVRHDDLIREPDTVLRRVLASLNLDANEEYIQAAAGIVSTKPNLSRNSVTWTAELIRDIENRIQEFPWLQGYAFSAPHANSS